MSLRIIRIVTFCKSFGINRAHPDIFIHRYPQLSIVNYPLGSVTNHWFGLYIAQSCFQRAYFFPDNFNNENFRKNILWHWCQLSLGLLTEQHNSRTDAMKPKQERNCSVITRYIGGHLIKFRQVIYLVGITGVMLSCSGSRKH